MKKISLSTREELSIYMSPVRKQLLRELSIANGPLTPKALSEKLNISPSSVQHHIKRLQSLGIVELDHTEVINGIKASFYKRAQVLVQIGLEKADDLSAEKEALVQDSLVRIFNGFNKQMHKRINQSGSRDVDMLSKWGDVLTGVVHLQEDKAVELMEHIRAFLEEHSEPTKNTSPWEYALIAYNAEEIGDE